MIFSKHFYDTYITYNDNTQLYWYIENNLNSRSWRNNPKQISSTCVSPYHRVEHAHVSVCIRRGRLMV